MSPSHVAPPVVDPLDRIRFPVDEWRLVESRFSAHDLGVTESLFAVGNGYLGMRGNHEESRDVEIPGTYVNGFHETWPIQHAEEAYGFAKVGQTMVNVPDAKVMRVYVDDEPLRLSTAELLEYSRVLDLREGVLTRDLLWRTASGNRVRVRSRRMVSFTQRHLAVMTLDVTVLDAPAAITISSQLVNRENGEDEQEILEALKREGMDPRRAEKLSRRVLLPESHRADRATGRLNLSYRCAQSRMAVAVAADHQLATENECAVGAESGDDLVKLVYRLRAEPGIPIHLTKTTAYHTAAAGSPRELVSWCERTLDRIGSEGVPHQFAEQAAWLRDFWERCDVEIAGHPELQQAVRWNLFSIAQASARAEGYGIPAKGVSGTGYGGHYFWDSEIYVVPFLTYTMPWAARNAIRFRYSMLDAARRRARELAQRGALFSWRTINGEEASAYYAAGTAQYHIDADISYALSQYVGATSDVDFLHREAIDILVETARLWADLGFWRSEHGGTFHIHGVTGPDEYTTVVNDNLYTNVLARFNLGSAAEAVEAMRVADPSAYESLRRRTALDEAEVSEWRRCAAGMYIPFDEYLGIHPQDSHFLEREMWDLGNTPMDKRPLLLNYHPLVIYRFQVLKQADVVAALFLQGEEFSLEQKRADFEYYDPITTGDSTLSAVVQSIIAAEVGYQELALRYFLSALYVDLADRHANTRDGVHIASTGGVWNALVGGFGGFRDHGNGTWCFDPRLPATWESLTFRLTLRSTRVRVTVRAQELELEVEDGEATLPFLVRDERVEVGPGAPAKVTLEGQGPLIEGVPRNPAGTQRADGTLISAIVPSGDQPTR
jgi:alpha,alpha-trehalose phosphorylase